MSKIQYPAQGFQLPRGRFVRGSMVKKTTTDHKKQPLPENKHHYWIAMAVPKNTPGVNDLNNAIVAHAWNSYAAVAGNQAVYQQMAMHLAAPSFAWKIDDGDAHETWKTREGCPGCWIYNMSTTFELNTFDNRNAILDAKCFELGDYIDAYITCAINGETDIRVAGIYINPKGIRWLDEGPRITVGADANQMFGAATGQGYYRSGGAPAMSGQVTGAQPPQAPVPGQYQQQPPMAPPAAPQPPQPAAPAPETDEQWNLRHTGHPAPGYRFNPATNGWDLAPTPAAPPPPAHQGYAAPQAPAPGYGNAPQYGAAPSHGHPGTSPNAHAGAPAAPVYGQQPPAAPAGAHGGPQGTAYPSNYGPGNPPPGVQQQNYAGGPPRV